MKQVLGIAGALLFSCTAWAGDHAADEKVIAGRFTDFSAAWKKDDAKVMASFWAPDGEIINPFGRLAQGRQEVEKLFAEEHSSFLKATDWACGGLRIRFVTDEVAVTSCDATVKRLDGTDAKVPPHNVTTVMQKKDGQWWIVAARVMIPAPMPGAPPAK